MRGYGEDPEWKTKELHDVTVVREEGSDIQTHAELSRPGADLVWHRDVHCQPRSSLSLRLNDIDSTDILIIDEDREATNPK